MRPSIFVLMASAILFGCSRQEKPIESRPPTTERVEPGIQPQTAENQPATSAVGRVMGSAERFEGTAAQGLTEEAIRSAIAPMAGAANVAVTFNDGKATLHGKVDNDQQKTAIGDAARNVPGVREVDNQIEVSSAAPAQPETTAPAPTPTPAPATE